MNLFKPESNIWYFIDLLLGVPFIKKDEVGKMCSTHGGRRNAYKILIQKKTTLGRPRIDETAILKQILGRYGMKDVKWMKLDQDRARGWRL